MEKMEKMEKIKNAEKVRRAKFFSAIILILGLSMILFGLFFQTGYWSGLYVGMGSSAFFSELVHVFILRD